MNEEELKRFEEYKKTQEKYTDYDNRIIYETENLEEGEEIEYIIDELEELVKFLRQNKDKNISVDIDADGIDVYQTIAETNEQFDKRMLEQWNALKQEHKKLKKVFE